MLLRLDEGVVIEGDVAGWERDFGGVDTPTLQEGTEREHYKVPFSSIQRSCTDATPIIRLPIAVTD